jgi:hypothetical protein
MHIRGAPAARQRDARAINPYQARSIQISRRSLLAGVGGLLLVGGPTVAPATPATALAIAVAAAGVITSVLEYSKRYSCGCCQRSSLMSGLSIKSRRRRVQIDRLSIQGRRLVPLVIVERPLSLAPHSLRWSRHCYCAIHTQDAPMKYGVSSSIHSYDKSDPGVLRGVQCNPVRISDTLVIVTIVLISKFSSLVVRV